MSPLPLCDNRYGDRFSDSFSTGYIFEEECLLASNEILFTCLTYDLTPWSRILPQKLIVAQLVKEFPVFYGTRCFTGICYWTLVSHFKVNPENHTLLY
jgi:hypothetical protein